MAAGDLTRVRPRTVWKREHPIQTVPFLQRRWRQRRSPRKVRRTARLKAAPVFPDRAGFPDGQREVVTGGRCLSNSSSRVVYEKAEHKISLCDCIVWYLLASRICFSCFSLILLEFTHSISRCFSFAVLIDEYKQRQCTAHTLAPLLQERNTRTEAEPVSVCTEAAALSSVCVMFTFFRSPVCSTTTWKAFRSECLRIDPLAALLF